MIEVVPAFPRRRNLEVSGWSRRAQDPPFLDLCCLFFPWEWECLYISKYIDVEKARKIEGTPIIFLDYVCFIGACRGWLSLVVGLEAGYRGCAIMVCAFFQGDFPGGNVARVSDLSSSLCVVNLKDIAWFGGRFWSCCRYREAGIQGYVKTPEAITFFRYWIGEKRKRFVDFYKRASEI